MNGAILEAFRHDEWANTQLLEFCRGVPEEQLAVPGTGTYAGVLETFNHILKGEAGYLRRLAGTGPAWVDDEGGGDPGDVDPRSLDLQALLSRAEEMGRRWKEFLSEPLDAERVIILDEGAYEAHAGVLVAQALHHGNAHREQISLMLTAAGFEPPGIQAWEYAHATGRGRDRKPDG